MAGNAVIGALRVDLGLNSAQFTTGLKQAQSGLSKFGVQLTYSLNGVVNELAKLAEAIPAAIKGSIDHADALSKAAQKAGVTVEALSQLEYAAKLSEISLDDLTSSLGKLSKSMVDATRNAHSGAATAFAALGVNIKDAAGNLRSSSSVFDDLAARFAKLPDSTTKTAIAIQLFGKSGAALIPILNQGADGLKRLADESDATGQTITTKTARAANEFNDTLTKIQLSIGGMVNEIMTGALPSLQAIANIFADPKFEHAVRDIGLDIIDTFKNALPYLQNFASNLNGLHDMFVDFDEKTQQGQRIAIINLENQVTDFENRIDENKQKLATGGFDTLFGINNAALQGQIDKDISAVQPLIDKIAELQKVMNGGSTTTGSAFLGGWGSEALNKPAASPTVPPIDLSKFTGATKAVHDWNDAIDGTITRNEELAAMIGDSLTSSIQNFVGAIMSGTNPLKAFGAELANIGQQLLNAGIQSLVSSIFTPNFIGGTLGAPALKLGFQTGIPGHAAGIASAPRGLAWVGENGPELMNFHGGESVTDAATSAAATGRSVVQVSLDPGLVGSILQQAASQSVQIVKSQAPAAVATAQRNRAM